MPMYIKTLHVVANAEEADAFNDSHDYCSEIYAPEYAIQYGALPHGRRFETAIIHYEGTRNSTYELNLAEFQRNDISRSFNDIDLHD